jgi:hypothetical protein
MVLCLRFFWPLQVFIRVLSLGGYLLNFRQNDQNTMLPSNRDQIFSPRLGDKVDSSRELRLTLARGCLL